MTTATATAVACAVCRDLLPELPSTDVVDHRVFKRGELAYIELAHRECAPEWAFPACAPQLAGETLADYGARVLRFMIEHDMPGLLTTAQLEQAAHAGVRAVLGYGSKVEEGRATALAGIQQARTRVAAVLAVRRDEEALEAWVKARQQPEAPELTKPEEVLNDVAQLTPEQKIAELLKELLVLSLNGLRPPKDPEGGVKAKLQPPTPILPSGSVALQP